MGGGKAAYHTHCPQLDSFRNSQFPRVTYVAQDCLCVCFRECVTHITCGGMVCNKIEKKPPPFAPTAQPSEGVGKPSINAHPSLPPPPAHHHKAPPEKHAQKPMMIIEIRTNHHYLVIDVYISVRGQWFHVLLILHCLYFGTFLALQQFY